MEEAELAVLAAAEGGIIGADDRGKIVFASPAESEAAGRPLPLGTPLEALVPERLRAQHRAGFKRYVETGVSRLEGKTVRVPTIQISGQEVEVDLTIRVFRRPDGSKLAVASMVRADAKTAPPDLVRIESALQARAYELI